MKPRILALLSAMILLGALGITRQTFAQKTQDRIITFDAAPNAQTYPASMNPQGEITGYYYDASHRQRGFLRDKDGTITSRSTLRAPTASFPNHRSACGWRRILDRKVDLLSSPRKRYGIIRLNASIT